MHTNLKIITVITLLLSSLVSAEETKLIETLWDKAKANSAPDTIHKKGKQTSDAVTLPYAIEGAKKPVLLKIVVPWDKEKKVATIYFKGGTAPYRVGDFVPPYYKLKSISPNLVVLDCVAEKEEDKEKCVSELSFSGIY